MLLDGNGLIYRGYFALPPLTTSKGELVNAVFGFCSIVLRGFQDIAPDYVVVAFDLAGTDVPPRAVRGLQGDAHSECPTTCATSSRRSAGSWRRWACRSTSSPASRPTTSSARSTVEAEALDLDTTIVTGDLDMLQIVSPSHEAHDDPTGRPEHDHLRPATGPGTVRPAARPDGRLQGPEGRLDRQHSRGRGHRREDRRQADPRSSARSTRCSTASTRSRPPKLREPLLEARERVLASRELMRIVRDAPGERSTSTRPSSTLRPRGRHPALPGVRVPDVDRSAAGAGRRIGGGGRRRPCARSARAARSRLPRSAGRPEGWGPAPSDRGQGASAARPAAGRPAGARSLIGQGAGLQLAMDFDAVAEAVAIRSGGCRQHGRSRGPHRR